MGTNKERMTEVIGGEVDQADGPVTLREQLEKMLPEVERAVGRSEIAQRIIRVGLTEVRRNPKLAAVPVTSILGCVMQSAQLRLDPGAPLGHCWYVPVWNKKVSGEVAEWWLGYTGMVELTRRTGTIGTVATAVVREGDTFDASIGSQGGLVHRVDWRATEDDRGDIYAAYCYVRHINGGEDWMVLNLDDIHRARAASSAWTYAESQGWTSTPWHTNFPEMARKTAVRRLWPYLPSSTEIHDAARADEQALSWDPARAERGVVIDADGPPLVELDSGDDDLSAMDLGDQIDRARDRRTEQAEEHSS